MSGSLSATSGVVSEIEHGGKVVFQRRPARCVWRTRKQIVGPVPTHPGQDQIGVRFGLPAKHQVDLQRFVDECGVACIRLDLLLQPEYEPRAEETLERRAIARFGCRLQALPLAQPEA